MAKLAAQGNMGLSKDKGGEMSALSPEECGGTTEKYSWTQTETEISIHIPLESFEVKGKECKIGDQTEDFGREDTRCNCF